MKKATNNAIAMISAMIAGTAKTSFLRAFKRNILFLFAGLMLMLSSCSRGSVGCNSFACKSNLKYSNERKYEKYSTNMYKCPVNQKYSR